MEPRILNGTQLIVGLVVIALGSLVYLLDRQVNGLPYLGAYAPNLLPIPQLLSDLGLSFPSFAHTLGFGLLTAAVVAGSRVGALAAAPFWGAVNLLFEVGQHAAVTPWIVNQLRRGTVAADFAHPLQCFFQSGTFDPMDIAAILTGSGVACIIVLLT